MELRTCIEWRNSLSWPRSVCISVHVAWTTGEQPVTYQLVNKQTNSDRRCPGRINQRCASLKNLLLLDTIIDEQELPCWAPAMAAGVQNNLRHVKASCQRGISFC